jgi:hypothetical protein
MRYEGKQLPAWVRLRPRKPRPMYGPPTLREHNWRQLIERTATAWEPLISANIQRDSALLGTVGGIDRGRWVFWRNRAMSERE